MVDTTDCSWLGQFPHKLNLNERPRILEKINQMARDAAGNMPVKEFRLWDDRRINWMYDYIHALGNEAFLEIAPSGSWVVFRSEDAEAELALFILQHS
jgi:hypothetical protein